MGTWHFNQSLVLYLDYIYFQYFVYALKYKNWFLYHLCKNDCWMFFAKSEMDYLSQFVMPFSKKNDVD